MLKIFLSLLLSSALFGDYYLSGGKKVTLTPLDAKEPFIKNRSTAPSLHYYKDSAGKRIGVDAKIIVSFKDLSAQFYIEKEFSLSLVKKLNDHLFVYRVKKTDDTLQVANRLSSLLAIAFAHPDFVIEKKGRTNDPLYRASWHLHGNAGINVEAAWKYTKGSGIIVGLYDEGIDIEHEDLRDNIVGYGNFNTDSGQIDLVAEGNALDNSLPNAPKPASDIWHGTSCAGLIAATGDNNRGSVGVAPQAKLLAVRYASSNISRDIEALYAMSKNGASIISNSWGTYAMNDAFNDALRDLSQRGRNGKGTLIFFAAGNGYNGEGCNMDLYYALLSNGQQRCENAPSKYNAPINDESESPYVISIAASTQYDRIADYSNYGSAIDFTGPGSQYPANIITTDAMGQKGAPNQWNYTDSFSGTSAAAPIVAGIAALVLSENPSLSKEEVLEIFKLTADKNGRFPYVNGRNNHWGYGRINAGKAVAMAANYGKISMENFAQKIYADMH